MAKYYMIGKRRIPLWAIIAINICAPVIGVLLGSVGIEFFFAEPSAAKAKIGPIRPGQEKVATIPWPQGNFTGGQLSMVLDVGVNNSLANNVVVTIDLLDPADKSKSYLVARLENFDTKRADGLLYTSRAVNLIPALTNLRGAVRQFNTTQVDVRARVQNKPKMPESNGMVFVTNAAIIGKPVPTVN